ncbi:MAG: DUF2141 domain-containing protein [Candidatus Kapabacteria bacterium]|nr:DUF2141 domain-containing protein [Candidatus Kapabacteria bacterium]
MKTKTLILITFVYAIALFADSPKTGTIIVEVEGFGNEKGIVFSHLYSEHLAEYFPTKSSNALHKRIVKVENLRATIVYENIPYGTYALTVHHDEDENKRMNRNFIGYPKEGFGLSNNPTIFLSVPDFDDCKFELRKDTVVVKIKLKFV